MDKGQFSGKSIDELKKIFAEAAGGAEVSAILMEGGFVQSRVKVEDRYEGIADLDFWVHFTDSLVSLACDILNTMPDGGGASVLELEILKLLFARRIDHLIEDAKKSGAIAGVK